MLKVAGAQLVLLKVIMIKTNNNKAGNGAGRLVEKKFRLLPSGLLLSLVLLCFSFHVLVLV